MKTTFILIALAASALLSSCATLNGVGTDVQRAGRNISNAASQ